MAIRLLSLFILFFSVSTGLAGTYYWVGGSGNWNDGNHWSFVSGGKPSGSVPTHSDEVVFDYYSLTEGSRVNINSPVSCASLYMSSIAGSLTITENNYLSVSGPVTLSPYTPIKGKGNFILSGSGGKMLFKPEATLIENDIILKSSGTYVLDGFLRSKGDFLLEKGELLAQNSFIDVRSIEAHRKVKADFTDAKILLTQEPELSSKNIIVNSESVTVQSLSGLMAIDSVQIIVNPPLCNGACNGSVTINVYSSSGGPYSGVLSATSQSCNFVLTPTSYGVTGTCSGLCTDTFILTVTDSSDNYQFQAFVSVPAPPAMAATFNDKSTPTCFGDCNGWMRASVIGGTAPYSYAWNTTPIQTNDTASGLCAGSYTVTVTDNNGCVQSFSSNLTQPPAVVPNVSSTNISCNGACDGTATTLPSGGNPPGNYTYSWVSNNPPFSSSSQNLTNLCPGTYVLTVSDDSLCTGIDSVVITEPLSLQLNPASTNISCGGACDGTAGITPTGGTAPYTVTWDNGMTGNTLTNLCPDTIKVVVSDANGCSDSVTFIITEPAPLFSNATFTDVLCFGACDGTATATPTGGTAPYSFSWSNGATGTGLTHTTTNLCPGTFVVTVTDANNCVHQDTVVISEPTLLTVGITATNITCFGACDGTASVNISGGTSGYSVLWSNGSTGNSISGICPDTISVMVTDANGCIANDTVIITEPAPLNVTLANDTISCSGLCNGTLVPVVTGGTPGYSFTWSNGGNGTGLCVGTYSVVVTDNNGCTATATADVVNPTPISVTISTTSATCFGVCNATATISPSGGFPPYTIVWCNGQTGSTATGLCGNTSCSVTITDSQGCSVTQTAFVSEPPALSSSTSVTNVLCAVQCTGTATVSPSGGTAPYLVTWNTTPTQGGNTISNLCVGTYVATITDANGCVLTDTAVVSEPLPIQVTQTTTNVSCAGLCDGTVTLSPTGGTGPYTVNWSNGLPPGLVQSNLCAGTYTAIITDVNNCADTVTINITQPPVLTGTVNIINASCGSICDGTANVIVGGGTQPYSYTWSTPVPQTTDTATNLCVGNYTVTVTDANNCSITLPVTITPVVFISINATGGQPSCFGVCDGQATAVATGGATPYTYNWSTGQNTQSASNLCGNVMYYVTATDANGCSNTDSILLPQPPQIQASFNVTNATCGNICNGSATATVNGGTTPYTYSWSNGQTGSTANNLCGGTYHLTITDANGCSVTDSVIIAAPTNIFSNASVTDATCNNSDGAILLNPSGGNSPYSYQWLSPFTNSNPLTNIPAGVYDVVITDATNCADTFSIIVNNINGPGLSTTTTPTSCPGGCNGTATALASGGTPGYTYQWSNGQTTQTATNLCAGIYSVSVTDALGCITSVFDTVQQPQPILSNGTVTDITCNAFCDGVVALNPSGGTGPYTFSWQSGQSTDTITGLCPGTYVVIITDANSCSVNDTFVVGNQTQIQINGVVADVTCNAACDGAININPTGGNPSYSYSWSPSGPNSPGLTNVCAGTYTVTVTDSLGCNAVAGFVVNEPTQLTASVSVNNISCQGQVNGSATVSASGGSGGYTYFWLPGGQSTSSVTGLAAGTYTVTICDSAAVTCCITQTVTITEPPLLTVSGSGTNLSCNNSCDGTLNANAGGGVAPYTFSWTGGLSGAVQSNLCAGSYIVTVTDANGCTANDTVILTQPSVINANSTVTHVSCFNACDGSININPTGGTGPYTYLWIPGNDTIQNLSGLCAGSYSVTITDANGCQNTQSITINQPLQITGTFTTSPATCGAIPCDGAINFIPSGGSGGPYSVLWSNGATTQNLTGVCAGLYTVHVTDASGCTDSVQVPLNSLNGPVTSHAATNATCFGSCDGSAVITATGPNNPFIYNWTPGGFTTDSVTGLCAGTYHVQVSDTIVCVSFETIVITEPAPIQGNPVVTNVSCTGLCDGQITMNPTGGSGVYTHAWNTGATTSTLSNLCPGIYIDTISDSNGCFGIDTVSVVVPNPLLVSGSSVNISCNGACDGYVNLLVSGGTAPYNIAWSNGNNQVSNGNTAIGNLCPGTITAAVTDANGCTDTISFTITEPPILALGANVSQISCNSACDGNVTLNVTGGSMPYSILWSNGSIGTSLQNLCPGSYSVVVTDNNGCQASQTFNITEPSTLTATLSSTNVSCNGACDGSAIVTATGGTAPYFYQWTPGGFTTDSLSNLCAGTYSVQVTDTNGCTFNGQVTITEPSVIQPNFVTAAPPCGACSGILSVNPTGGSGPAYSYLWNTGVTTSTVNNLCAGIYNVDITDGSGCTQNFSIGLSNINGPVVTTSAIDPGCNNVCDGSIAASASGAVAPYTFSWSPGGSTSDSIGNLCAGIYHVQVSDSNGCITIASDTLINPPAINVSSSVVNSTCGLCDGSATLTASGGVAPYTYLWGNGNTGSSQTGLCAGTYSVMVTDASGCSETVNVLISNSGGPTGEQITTTPVSCFGVNDGSATITGLGGVPPYSYLWIPGNYNTSSVSGLAAGTYSVQITDAIGCSRIASVTIQTPSQIQANPIVTNNTCGLCDGSIVLNPSGGTLPYSYSWSGGLPGGSTQTNLCAGLYTVVITDDNGCSETATIPVNSSSAPNVTATATGNSCNQSCDGTATVVASGGVSPYTYLWSDGSTSSTVSGLCAGTYTVQAIDANGCAGSAQVTVSEPPVLSFSIPGVTDVSCFGNCDGAATVVPSGGSVPYSISWSPSGQTSQTAQNLCSGIHLVTVTDANGCTGSQSITINSSSALSGTFNSTDATCGQCDGSTTVTPSGGTAPYNFLWADGSTGANRTGLCAGVHSVTITDASGCSEQISVTINNAGGPSGVITSQTNLTCFGDNNGSATVTPSGGTPPYSILWVPGGQTTGSVNGLSAGTYNVQIVDANNCQTSVPVTITEPLDLAVSPVIYNADCGQCNGTVLLQVSGGAQPYTYNWTGGLPATSSQTGLCAGVYSVTITDANGCSRTEVIPVSSTNGPNLAINTTSVSCNGQCDGSVSVTATGGSGNYSYLWSPGGQTSSSVSGLCAGSYYVQVTDQTSGCITINTGTISEPDSIYFSQVFTQNASCGGTCDGVATVMPSGGTMPYTYTWSGGGTGSTDSTLCAGSNTVTITDANGCTQTQTITISQPVQLVIDTTQIVNPSCSNINDGAIDISVLGGNPGYTFQWSSGQNTEDLTSIPAGVYTIVVTDASGCMDSLTINLQPLVPIQVNAGIDTAYCEGLGPVVLTGTGASGYQWRDQSGNILGNSVNLTVNPSPGVHIYILTGTSGGCQDNDTVIVTVYPGAFADAGADASVLQGQSTQIGGNPSGPAGSTFNWMPTEGLSSNTISNPVSTPVINMLYYLTVTTPDGCVATDSVRVIILPDILFPDGITPNGDGKNDEWIIDNIHLFPGCLVEIYNRWGQLLFSSPGYTERWDGRYEGKLLPVGTYYYVIDLNDERYEPFTGPITIMR